MSPTYTFKINMLDLLNLALKCGRLSYAICWMFQVSVLADDILKNVEYDALRIVFNKFHSVVSFLPTVSTILSPEVLLCTVFFILSAVLKFF